MKRQRLRPRTPSFIHCFAVLSIPPLPRDKFAVWRDLRIILRYAADILVSLRIGPALPHRHYYTGITTPALPHRHYRTGITAPSTFVDFFWLLTFSYFQRRRSDNSGKICICWDDIPLFLPNWFSSSTNTSRETTGARRSLGRGGSELGYHLRKFEEVSPREKAFSGVRT